MDSACELQAARLSSWQILFCLGQQWLAFQSDLSDLRSFLLLSAKELSSGEKREEVTQVTRARLTFYSLTFWEFSIEIQSLSPLVPGPDPAASHLATPCQMGQDTCLDPCTIFYLLSVRGVYFGNMPQGSGPWLSQEWPWDLDFRPHHFLKLLLWKGIWHPPGIAEDDRKSGEAPSPVTKQCKFIRF